MPGVGPGYCVAVTASSVWRKEGRGNTEKPCADNCQLVFQQWLGAFLGAGVTVEEISSMQVTALSGAMCSFATAQGILAAEPHALDNSATVGCLRARWYVKSGPTWFRFRENPLFAFGRFCLQSQSALQNELLFSGQPS